MQTITPFLWFETGAREAAEYYVSVFGGDSRVVSNTTLTNTPSGTVEIVTVSLRGSELTLMSAGPYEKINSAVSFVVACADQAELDHFWSTLSAVPEAEQCGWCKDRFGVTWQVVPARHAEMMSQGTPEQIARVTKAFLQMKKFDIATLERAYTGDA